MGSLLGFYTLHIVLSTKTIIFLKMILLTFLFHYLWNVFLFLETFLLSTKTIILVVNFLSHISIIFTQFTSMLEVEGGS